MYFNVYLYNTISTDPGYISAMVGWSAAAATLTTLLMGALSDRVGKRKLFICGGYLLWGLSTAAFGLVTVENAAKLFPAASAAAAAAVMIVVLDCVMTFSARRPTTRRSTRGSPTPCRTRRGARQNPCWPFCRSFPCSSFWPVRRHDTARGMAEILRDLRRTRCSDGSCVRLPDPGAEAGAETGQWSKNLVYGLRPSVVRGNPALYLSFAAFCLFSVAVQVFFPYLIIYMQNYLHFDGYALVLGIVLIFASVVSVLSGRVIDRLGELRCVLPAAGSCSRDCSGCSSRGRCWP